MSRLEKRFASLQAAGKKALIPYICAGDPSLESTVPLLHELVRSGASAIELGMPFSDPMADGPVIQRASERAISRGSNLDFVFNCVKEFRKTDSDTPIVLMGYANPVECRGQEAFIRDAAEAGVDGVLIVDYPFDEVPEFYEAVKKAGMDPIFLLAPTSSDERDRVPLLRVAEGNHGGRKPARYRFGETKRRENRALREVPGGCGVRYQ